MRCPSYKFTFDRADYDYADGVVPPRLRELRRLAKLTNMARQEYSPDAKDRYRIRVYGRLGKHNPAYNHYYRSRGNCRLNDATRYDVYVQTYRIYDEAN